MRLFLGGGDGGGPGRLVGGPLAAALVAPALLAALTLFGLPVLAKPLHANQVGYRSAGLWLAEHAKPDDQILDWHNSATYYAGRLCPDQGHGVPPITYAVVEEPQRNALPADVQQQIDQVIRQGKVVFRCPAELGRKTGPGNRRLRQSAGGP